MTDGIQDHPELPRRQYEIFDVLRQYRGSVVTFETLAKRIYGPAASVERTTSALRSNIQHLRRSLGGSEEIETVPRRGFRLKHKPSPYLPVQDRIAPRLRRDGVLDDRDCSRCNQPFKTLGHGDSLCTFCVAGIPRTVRTRHEGRVR